MPSLLGLPAHADRHRAPKALAIRALLLERIDVVDADRSKVARPEYCVRVGSYIDGLILGAPASACLDTFRLFLRNRQSISRHACPPCARFATLCLPTAILCCWSGPACPLNSYPAL